MATIKSQIKALLATRNLRPEDELEHPESNELRTAQYWAEFIVKEPEIAARDGVIDDVYYFRTEFNELLITGRRHDKWYR